MKRSDFAAKIVTAALILTFSALPVVMAVTTIRTEYSAVELQLSKTFKLQPEEIRQWQTVRRDGGYRGFANVDDLSVYAVLALSADTDTELRRLARLHLQKDQAVLQRLLKFEEILQHEAKRKAKR